MNGLKDKVALITGAAGDIGHSIARAFLERGARVNLTDIDGERLAQRAGELAAGDAVTTTPGDLADPKVIEAITAAALASCGRVDILVNNAAIQAPGDLDSCSRELFDLAYAVNVRAPFLLTRALVPFMRKAGGGAIVNITSVHATATGPHRVAYATTKTALLGLTRSLAVDLGGDNIRVNAVSPSATMTSQLKAGWAQIGGTTDVMAHAHRQHPLGRIAEAEEIAEAVVFLAEAKFVHGVELRVDGGLLSSLRLLPIEDKA